MPHDMEQLSHLRSIFREHAQSTLFIDHETSRELSYAQSLAASVALARELSEQGICKGDNICIIADNSLEMLHIFFALWQCGACAVPLNPQLASEHITDIIACSGAKHVLSGANHITLTSEACEDIPDANITILPFNTQETPCPDDVQTRQKTNVNDEIDIALMLKNTQPDARHIAFEALDGDAPCMIIFTSGSTAAPKGVSISINRLVANERIFCEALGLNAHSRFMHIFPMSYLAGTHNVLLLPMSVGASIVISPPLGGATLFSFWEMVKDHKINTLWFTSTMLSMLLKVDDGEDLSWLKEQIVCGIVGMAPLPAATKEAFETRFGFDLHENFALSETAFISTSLPGRTLSEGSKGFVLDGVTVESRLLDDRNTRCEEGIEGEMLVRSPHLMLGYFNASEDDNANMSEEGFFTGDIGYVKNGELFLTGRKKDLIIRGGINIPPALVEASIAQIPDVMDVAVVGTPHKEYGEEVAAAITLKAGADADAFTAKHLQAAVKGKLAYFQQPKKIKIIDQMPKGLTGKTDKKAVRALFAPTA